jgi:hypothetical protein
MSQSTIGLEKERGLPVSREVTWLQGLPYNLEVLGSRPGTKRKEEGAAQIRQERIQIHKGCYESKNLFE